MKWSIVIPTFRRAKSLRRTLASLHGQSVRNFEVIVVCDGEDPETRAVSKDYVFPGSIRWIFHACNLGLSAARNTGAKAAGGEFLLFLDDDVIACAELLQHHAAEHLACPSWPNLLVFGRIVEQRELPFFSKTDYLIQMGRQRYLECVHPEDGLPDTMSVGAKAETTACFGLNCSIRKTAFLEAGGFDERLRTDEEMELGYRLYLKGFLRRYAQNAKINHFGGKDLSQYNPHCWASSGRNDLYRVDVLGQRCAQTAQLALMRHGAFVQRAIHRSIWQCPHLFLALAAGLENLTDSTGSKFSFALWARLRRIAEYWNAVKETGISYRELHQLAGPLGRILVFHSISVPQNDREARYYVSPDRFHRFISSMRALRYEFADPLDWISGQICNRSVLLTFDDAYDDLYTELLPLVQSSRCRPIVFLVTEQLGGSNSWDKNKGLRSRSLLTLSQIREMQKYGVVFGAHSLSHPFLTTLSDSSLRREVRDSRAHLEDILGVEVEWFAYPHGDVDLRVRAAVAEAGYKAAVTTHEGFSSWQDPLALNRIEPNDFVTLFNFLVTLSTGRDLQNGIKRRLRRTLRRIADV